MVRVRVRVKVAVRVRVRTIRTNYSITLPEQARFEQLRGQLAGPWQTAARVVGAKSLRSIIIPVSCNGK